MSFRNTVNPSGVVPLERVVQPLNPDKHLLERILAKENVAEAWKQVKANRGASGVDGITVDKFPEHTRSHWSEIRQSIVEGYFEHKVYT